jgi:betaine-aldehyde dehydrogenase
LPFALAAGCTAVVKPSELTPSSTVILGELLQEAGVPAGVVNIVLGFGDPVGAMLSTHPSVGHGVLHRLHRSGKAHRRGGQRDAEEGEPRAWRQNPQVIFPDADLDQAADAITFGVYFNAGECCNSGSRIIVHEDVAQALVEKVVALSRKVPFGDPLDPRTQVGAIISPEHLDKIDGYVKGAAKAGAGVALGGAAISVDGLAGQFYGPTVVTGVTPQMPIATEEGLRPGPVGPDLRDAGRGHRACQFGVLRAVGGRLEPGHVDLPRLRAAGACRHGLDQHLDGRVR